MPVPSTTTVPIGIRHLVIDNFRGIDHLELDFPDAHGNASDIVVLGGPNGSGKTAVLEACLMVLGAEALLEGVAAKRAVRFGASNYGIMARMQTPQGQLSGEIHGFTGPKWWDAGGPHANLPAPIPCLYFSSSRAPKLVGPVPITAGRQGGADKYDSEVNRLGLLKQYLVNAKAHAFMRVTTTPPPGYRSQFEESIQRLNDAWGLFYRGAGQQFVVEPVSDAPEAGFDVFLSGPDGLRVPMDSLSSGQLELFTLFGSLLRLRFREGLLVIDEPELHLDPQWHVLIVRALRHVLPQAQLLLATHSPALYDSVYSFQRHYLIPPGDPRLVAWKPMLDREAP